uniref:Zona pellucida sperm-binding protein 4 n=1 Tax=Echeneis naucrates TaxID=173247 RepID=A0A665URY5_ECHNA
MADKLICGCLLAVAILASLGDAQYSKNPKRPQRPLYPPQEPQRQHLTPPKRGGEQNTQQAKIPQQSNVPPHTKLPNPSFHTCEVEEASKISCGLPGITASECDHINCCFDGRMCYYGKAVTLQCTKDAQFIVVVARDATLPNLDLETIRFLGSDQNCGPIGTTSAFAIYQFPVTACGTVEEPGTLIYENRMASSFEVAVGRWGAVTRDSSFELIIQCKYIGTSVEALVIEVGNVPPPPPVAAPGPLRVELRLGNGICISKGCVEGYSYYQDADYPVPKVLRDPVYVEVRMLERTDPNIVLTLGRCWATCDPYPHSLPQWDLLIDGCPYRDDRYLTQLVPVGSSPDILYPTHYRRFIFKMFTFVATSSVIPLREKVYIHCDATVCQPSLGNNCEPRCFRKNIVASVQKGTRAETTLVSSRELVFSQPADGTQQSQ